MKKADKKLIFLLGNILTSVFILTSVMILKNTSTLYKPMSTFDSKYMAQIKNEESAENLKHGIFYTEVARADAYKTIIRQNNHFSTIGILASFVLISNCIFFYSIKS